jgi:hypothetical protein
MKQYFVCCCLFKEIAWHLGEFIVFMKIFRVKYKQREFAILTQYFELKQVAEAVATLKASV